MKGVDFAFDYSMHVRVSSMIGVSTSNKLGRDDLKRLLTRPKLPVQRLNRQNRQVLRPGFTDLLEAVLWRFRGKLTQRSSDLSRLLSNAVCARLLCASNVDS